MKWNLRGKIRSNIFREVKQRKMASYQRRSKLAVVTYACIPRAQILRKRRTVSLGTTLLVHGVFLLCLDSQRAGGVAFWFCIIFVPLTPIPECPHLYSFSSRHLCLFAILQTQHKDLRSNSRHFDLFDNNSCPMFSTGLTSSFSWVDI